MLTLPPGVKLFYHVAPTDMRRGFDRLAAMAREVLEKDPRDGHLFFFRNRGGDRLKILYWDGDGFVLWYKRLEKGVFKFPAATAAALELTRRDLNILLGGIDPKSARPLPRYQSPP